MTNMDNRNSGAVQDVTSVWENIDKDFDRLKEINKLHCKLTHETLNLIGISNPSQHTVDIDKITNAIDSKCEISSLNPGNIYDNTNESENVIFGFSETERMQENMINSYTNGVEFKDENKFYLDHENDVNLHFSSQQEVNKENKDVKMTHCNYDSVRVSIGGNELLPNSLLNNTIKDVDYDCRNSNFDKINLNSTSLKKKQKMNILKNEEIKKGMYYENIFNDEKDKKNIIGMSEIYTDEPNIRPFTVNKNNKFLINEKGSKLYECPDLNNYIYKNNENKTSLSLSCLDKLKGINKNKYESFKVMSEEIAPNFYNYRYDNNVKMDNSKKENTKCFNLEKTNNLVKHNYFPSEAHIDMLNPLEKKNWKHHILDKSEQKMLFLRDERKNDYENESSQIIGGSEKNSDIYTHNIYHANSSKHKEDNEEEHTKRLPNEIDDLNHAFLINRSKRLIQRSKKCLNVFTNVSDTDTNEWNKNFSDLNEETEHTLIKKNTKLYPNVPLKEHFINTSQKQDSELMSKPMSKLSSSPDSNSNSNSNSDDEEEEEEEEEIEDVYINEKGKKEVYVYKKKKEIDEGSSCINRNMQMYVNAEECLYENGKDLGHLKKTNAVEYNVFSNQLLLPNQNQEKHIEGKEDSEEENMSEENISEEEMSEDDMSEEEMSEEELSEEELSEEEISEEEDTEEEISEKEDIEEEKGDRETRILECNDISKKLSSNHPEKKYENTQFENDIKEEKDIDKMGLFYMHMNSQKNKRLEPITENAKDTNAYKVKENVNDEVNKQKNEYSDNKNEKINIPIILKENNYLKNKFYQTPFYNISEKGSDTTIYKYEHLTKQEKHESQEFDFGINAKNVNDSLSDKKFFSVEQVPLERKKKDIKESKGNEEREEEKKEAEKKSPKWKGYDDLSNTLTTKGKDLSLENNKENLETEQKIEKENKKGLESFNVNEKLSLSTSQQHYEINVENKSFKKELTTKDINEEDYVKKNIEHNNFHMNEKHIESDNEKKGKLERIENLEEQENEIKKKNKTQTKTKTKTKKKRDEKKSEDVTTFENTQNKNILNEPNPNIINTENDPLKIVALNLLNTNDVNKICEIIKERYYLGELCEKRKNTIQKYKIENVKLGLEIQSLLNFNNSLISVLKEKDAEGKLLKRKTEEMEMEIQLMKKNITQEKREMQLSNAFSSSNENKKYGGKQSVRGILYDKEQTLNKSEDINIQDKKLIMLQRAYEHKIHELEAALKIFKMKNSDLQEQLNIFMNE